MNRLLRLIGLGLASAPLALAGCTAAPAVVEQTEHAPAEASGGVGVAQSALTDEEAARQWVFDRVDRAPGTIIGSPYYYVLRNTANGQYLRYHKTLSGVNLEFSTTREDDFHLAPKSGGYPIRFTNDVAFAGREGGWLESFPRVIGVSLRFTDTPAYEWIVYGGTQDAAVPTGTPVSLYNRRKNDYLIYCERTGGAADLGWASTCGQSATPTGVNASLRLKVGNPVAGVLSCPGTVTTTYSFSPLALTGQAGRSTSFTVTDVGDTTGTCVTSEPALDVRAGTWRVTATSGAFSATCDAVLSSSPLQDPINFKFGQAGCTRGGAFPGE